jgi:outer membrane protein OmpA-like peptidoglycan-associated protein
MLKRVIRCLAAVAALLSGVAGCGNFGLTSPTGKTVACPWLSEAPAAQSASVQSDTVVMIDISASSWPKSGQSADLPEGRLVQFVVHQLLTNFNSAGTRLISLGLYDGSSATIDWKLGGVALPVPTGNGQAIQVEYHAAGHCLTKMVASVASTAPRTPGTDEMAALAGAAGQLQGPAAHAHVVLITDGLSNTGCLDLSTVLRQGRKASAVLASCPERASLAALRGVSLKLYGIGYQAANPPLSTAEQAWVESYWQELCAGLDVASASSCLAPAGSDTARTSNVSRLADPRVVFPTVSDKVGSVPIPADLLFAFNSSVLSAAGQSYLDILLQQIKGQGRTITKVVGHTDAVGTAAYNMGLSQRRADAVRTYLASHGFTGVTAVGVGEADPACSPEYTPGGAPIASCMAKDRRVQIILGG